MPNVKIKTFRGAVACNGYFLMDGNWQDPDRDTDRVAPDGKLLPGEIVTIPDGHPALESELIEITTEKAHRKILVLPEGAAKKRRGRPPKDRTNAELRPDE